MNFVWETFLVAALSQLPFYLIAILRRTDKVTDFAYGLGFFAVANYWLFKLDIASAPQIVLAVMVSAWAARISTYLFIRINKIKRDKRFDDKRKNKLKFSGFWIIQTVTIGVVMLPTAYHLSRDSLNHYDSLMLVGGLVFAIGLLLETVADIQLYNFRNNKNNENKWIASGVWKYSRHPNYFGEMLVWWGIYIYGLDYFGNLGWLTIVSPIYIMALIIFVSGIPLLEKKNDERWGGNKGYQAYRRSTSVLVPWFKKSS